MEYSGLADGFALKIADSMKSRTLTSCSRWAQARRIMGHPFPGPYSWEHHPWVKEMHDADAPFCYAMKGAQLGVTEVAINRALYTIDQARRDVLYVLPTMGNATDFSKTRFSTALSLSPYLGSIFTDTDTVSLKQAGSNSLYIRGSKSDSGLKSIPVSELILDEVDEMDQKQIWLALERLSGQVVKHVWGLSTPTLPNFGIHKLYETSTKDHFHFRCPRCGKATELVWPDCVEICGESVSDPRVRDSYLKCKECKGKLDHKAKPDWLKDAYWVTTDQTADPDIRGFYINQLYSFTVSPPELVTSYFRGFGDELAAKEFHNSKLGLPFVGEGAKVTKDDVDSCVRDYSKQDARPTIGGEKIITLGVDQGKWNYAEVCEWTVPFWGPDMNSHAHCKVVYEQRFYEDEWNETLDSLMRDWQVLACVIDADPNVMEAARFAKKYRGFVWLCRYRRGVTGKEIAISDYSEDAPMATVDRTAWLSQSLGRFRTGRIELPRDVSRQYIEHVQSPVRTYERDDQGNPKAVFVSTGADHFAHARNYAEIALPLVGARDTNSNIEKFV